MVPKSAQHSEIATDLFFGGMVREEIGGYHPGKFFAGLLRTAQSAGVVIHSDTTVKDITDLTPNLARENGPVFISSHSASCV